MAHALSKTPCVVPVGFSLGLFARLKGLTPSGRSWFLIPRAQHGRASFPLSYVPCDRSDTRMSSIFPALLLVVSRPLLVVSRSPARRRARNDKQEPQRPCS